MVYASADSEHTDSFHNIYYIHTGVYIYIIIILYIYIYIHGYHLVGVI